MQPSTNLHTQASDTHRIKIYLRSYRLKHIFIPSHKILQLYMEKTAFTRENAYWRLVEEANDARASIQTGLFLDSTIFFFFKDFY